MRIAILSDIHDNLWNLRPALNAVTACDALICCGDLCSPFVIDELAAFPGPLHVVFGNNDADLYRITSKAARKPDINLHGELFEHTFDGLRFAVNHFDYVAKGLAQSGLYDIVCFGHNHDFEITRVAGCLKLNPGSIMGSRFGGGLWEETTPTFLIFDTRTQLAEGYEIDRTSKAIQRRHA
jgi:putative phosphoesterase